jgi:hypothetical protein
MAEVLMEFPELTMDFNGVEERALVEKIALEKN